MVNMATSTAKVPGAFGQALKFDGSNDYVDIADVDASLASNSSISVWINPRSVSVSHRIFGGRTNSAPVVGIYPSPYGIIASGATQGNQRTGSTSTVKLNAWNHLVVTYDATSIPTIYVNGVEVTYTASTYWGTTNSTIGKAGGNTFQGMIDDVRLYSRVLTSKEIKQLYSQGGSKLNSQPVNAGGDTLKSGLVGHWTFDGADLVSNVTDKSGQGNNGNMSGFTSTTTAKVGGVLGQALKFDGSNDYIRVPHSASYKSNSQAFSFWMYPRQIPSSDYDGVLGIITSDSNAFEVFVNSNSSVLSAGSYPWQLTYTIPAKNKWYHVYIETVSGAGKIYVNGVLQDTGTVTYGGASNTADFYIGSRNTSYFFPGYLDDVRIYNRALSELEIKKLYNMGR
jgi:hypothetical protein